jgi:hypothetical protein
MNRSLTPQELVNFGLTAPPEIATADSGPNPVGLRWQLDSDPAAMPTEPPMLVLVLVENVNLDALGVGEAIQEHLNSPGGAADNHAILDVADDIDGLAPGDLKIVSSEQISRIRRAAGKLPLQCPVGGDQEGIGLNQKIGW